MDNQKILGKIKFVNKHSNSVSALEHFSNELEDFRKAIQFNKQNKSQKKPTILPQINPKSRYGKKKQEVELMEAENKVGQLDARLGKLEKNKQIFIRNNQIKTILDSIENISQYRHIQSLQRMNAYRNQISSPSFVFYPVPMFNAGNPYNIYPSSYNPHSQPYNQNYQQNNESQAEQAKKSKLPQARRKYLKRRMKIVFMSVYFIFLFKTFSRIITYRRYEKFLQLQEIMVQHETLEYYLFEKYLKYDMYNNFYKLCRGEQTKIGKQYEIQVPYDEEKISVNLKIGQIFISDLLDKVQKSVQQGEFKILNPIFMNFLDRGFPPSFVFVEEQLKLMNLHKEFGWLNITPETSKIFIIVYFFIKIFIYQLIGKKEILTILHKAYRKKWTQKKYILLYGKKLTSTLIILYSVLNQIFFTSMNNKQVSPNYAEVPQEPRPQLMEQMVCSLNISEDKDKTDKKQLIKELYCDQAHTYLFIEIFEQNWIKIRRIGQMFYQAALNEKINQLIKFKREALEQKFPSRSLLYNIRKNALSEEKKKSLKASNKHISQTLTDFNKSNNKNPEEKKKKVKI